MKKVIISLLAMSCAYSASATVINEWNMNDVAGTRLNAVANTGTQPNAFDSYNHTSSKFATDGVGNLHVSPQTDALARKAGTKDYTDATISISDDVQVIYQLN